MQWEDVAAIVNSPGGIAMLALAILWTGSRATWVWGWVHREAIKAERERANEWKDIATGMLPVAEKAVEQIERRTKARDE